MRVFNPLQVNVALRQHSINLSYFSRFTLLLHFFFIVQTNVFSHRCFFHLHSAIDALIICRFKLQILKFEGVRMHSMEKNIEYSKVSDRYKKFLLKFILLRKNLHFTYYTIVKNYFLILKKLVIYINIYVKI